MKIDLLNYAWNIIKYIEIYLLLKFETEEEQVKECMIKWAISFGNNIEMEQWENMRLKGLKFTLCYNQIF